MRIKGTVWDFDKSCEKTIQTDIHIGNYSVSYMLLLINNIID